MPSITPVLRVHKKNKHGLCPVYLRITDAQRSRYQSLRLAIKESDWNPKAKTAFVRKSHADHEDLNAAIAQAVADANRAVARANAEGKRLNAAEIKEAVSERPASSPSNFWPFADSFAEGYKTRGEIWSYDRFRSVLKKFRAFTGDPFPFEALTPALLRQYEDHLVSTYGNGINTVATAMKAIRTVVRRAVAEGHIGFADNPFNGHRIKHEQTERVRLTLAEVQKIEALELSPGTIEAVARDCWLFAFYTGGTRVGDVIQTRWQSVAGGKHTYRMGKNKKSGSVRLVPQAQAVLDRYAPSHDKADPAAFVFPLLANRDLSTPELKKRALQSRTTQINKALKEVARAAGVRKHLTSHVARHSWADLARRMGWDLYSISRVLRHSNLKVTERYLDSFDEEDINRRMGEMFSAGAPPSA